MSNNTDSLEFKFLDVPEFGQALEVYEGVFWARIPMPWVLDHINIYIFRETNGWTVIDTGPKTKKSIEVWEALDKNLLKGEPVVRVLATHMHPDHIGMAGWICEKYGSEFLITKSELNQARLLWATSDGKTPEYEVDFLLRGGLSKDKVEISAEEDGWKFSDVVCEIPMPYTRLMDQMIITLGEKRWRVIEGRGHSPEHACLECMDAPLFIAGDQVLGRITANVSVNASEPNGNPLAHWFVSLNRMHAVVGDPLVLPSHDGLYTGLHCRLNELIDGHLRKCERLLDHCVEPKNVVETFPSLYRRKIKGLDFHLGLGEAVSHLRLMESVGAIKRDSSADVDLYQTIEKIDDAEIIKRVNALDYVQMAHLPSF